MQKRILRVGAVIISLVCLSNNYIVYAESNNSIQQEIDKNNSIIEGLESEKNEIDSQINEEEAQLNTIEQQILAKKEDLDKARQDVEKYQYDIDTLDQEINEAQSVIDSIESEISEKEKVITTLIEEQELKSRLLNGRIRNYYKMDISLQYIYMLLKSENIFDVFNNMNYIWKLIKLDKGLIEEAKIKEESIRVEKENIQIALEEQEIKKQFVVDKQSQLLEVQKEFIAIKENEENKIYELQALESQKSQIIASLEIEGENINSQIMDLVSFNKELQEKLDDIFTDINNGNGSGEDKPNEPTEVEYLRPGNGVITDSFGPRINPVTGERGYHYGIDYAEDYGTVVKASKSGIVEYSGWIEGYGNTIIIDHGSGIQTLYAHNQSLSVSVGQSVVQGQEVARVGSTGMSTGPHIHFEIRINGQAVDPFIYIPY